MTDYSQYPQYPQSPQAPQYSPDGPGGYGPQGTPGAYGYYPPGSQFGPPPENNLVWGILSTIMCCQPLGIVSIVKASQVNSLWALGQFDAARKAADDARKFAIWSAATFVVIAVAVTLIYAIAFIVSMSSSGY